MSDTETATESNEASKPRTPRATPKEVAQNQLEAIQQRVGKLVERLEGWGDEKLSVALATVLDGLAVTATALADAAVPTGPQTHVGREFRLKGSSLRFYAGLVEKDDVMKVEAVRSGRHVITTNRGVVQSIHLNHVEWLDETAE